MPTINATLGVGTGASGTTDVSYQLRNSTGQTSGSAVTLQNYGADTTVAYISIYRFVSLGLPAGATITSATLNLYAPTSGRLVNNADIFCEKVQNPSVNPASASVTGRTLTTASTSYTSTMTVSTYNTTPSFATALQEVVNINTSTAINTLHVLIRSKTGVGFGQCEYAGHNNGGTGTSPSNGLTGGVTTNE